MYTAMHHLAVPATFPDLTSASPLDDLCVAAHLAGARAGRGDAAANAARLNEAGTGQGVLDSDAACVAFLADPDTRGALEDWLGAYAADEIVIDRLEPEARAEVLAAAWSSYSTAVYQARDAARVAARAGASA